MPVYMSSLDSSNLTLLDVFVLFGAIYGFNDLNLYFLGPKVSCESSWSLLLDLIEFLELPLLELFLFSLLFFLSTSTISVSSFSIYFSRSLIS